MTCELHGDNCPNIRTGPRGLHPYCTERNVKFSRDVFTPEIAKSTDSKCALTKIFALCALSRRARANELLIEKYPRPNCHKIWDLLHQAILAHFWHVSFESSRRVMISILDSYSDTSPRRIEVANAAFIVGLFRHEHLANASLEKAKEPHRIKDDAWLSNVGRMKKSLLYTPPIWLFYHELFRRNLHGISVLRHSNKGLLMGKKMLELLQPSPLSESQIVLYSHYYERRPKHSWGSNILAYLDDDIDTVLNFCCGNGTIDNDQFKISDYDPVTNPEMPTKKFDAVLALSVLNRTAEQDLLTITQWLELYAKKQIVMLISDEPNGTLADGSPVNVTVKNAQWWVEKCNNLFHNFHCVEKYQKDGQIVLSATRKKERSLLLK